MLKRFSDFLQKDESASGLSSSFFFFFFFPPSKPQVPSNPAEEPVLWK